MTVAPHSLSAITRGHTAKPVIVDTARVVGWTVPVMALGDVCAGECAPPATPLQAAARAWLLAHRIPARANLVLCCTLVRHKTQEGLGRVGLGREGIASFAFTHEAQSLALVSMPIVFAEHEGLTHVDAGPLLRITMRGDRVLFATTSLWQDLGIAGGRYEPALTIDRAP
jgi:hypothetical protein